MTFRPTLTYVPFDFTHLTLDLRPLHSMLDRFTTFVS